VKTLNLYSVSLKSNGGSELTINVAAETQVKARQQAKEYMPQYSVRSVKRTGNVNVPLTLPAGL
jgi:hypothetical protein